MDWSELAVTTLELRRRRSGCLYDPGDPDPDNGAAVV